MTYKLADVFFKNKSGICIISYWRSVLCIILGLLLSHQSIAHRDDEQGEDEISVTIEVKGLGGVEIPAVIHNKEVLLSVNSVFDFLKIRNTPSPAFDSITGFYINQQDVFLIDKTQNRIYFKDKVYDLNATDLVRTESNLYLNLKYFKTVFDLDGVFIFRRLLVTLSSGVELPAIREMRLEVMRRNVSKLKGELKADTTLKRSYPLFHLGAADWAVVSTQQNLGNTDTRLNLGLGSIIAGGEANASLNYYTSSPLTEKQQYYQWHFVNNDLQALRQVSAGKIYTPSISSLYAPLVGVQFNNTPTIQRRSYGTYTLSNTTEAGWIVELYINEVLVDYKKTDASGFYSFEVPLIYGYSVIKLRFYGPWGEERTSQQYINVPFNFLPSGEFEYSVTGGIIEDGNNSRFSRITTNYGLSKHFTIGGGFEYLSSISSGNNIPFINSSLRLASHLLLTGEYAYKVKSRGVLSYRMPSNLQFDLDYTKYDPNQTAIYYKYLEDRKVMITMPFRSFGSAVFGKLSIDQIILPYSKFTNAEMAFSGSTHGVGMNFTTYASFTPNVSPYTYSVLSLSYMFWAKIFTTGQMQYDFRQNRPDFVKISFEKHLLGNGYMNIAFQEYFNSNNMNALLGLRYDFSFARVSASALTGSNNTYSRVESASGSFLIDGKTNYFNVNNRSNVGKGGIVVVPYLDMNCNGIRDPDEPAAPSLKIHVNGGRTVYNNKDTTIRVSELEPYTNYYIDLDRNSFDNISWQLKKHTIKVTVIPNNFTEVDIPVAVEGEISGMVSIKEKGSKYAKGQGQIIVCIYNSDSTLFTRIVTESDGYFSYLGLPPGSYTVGPDTVQLRKLHFSVTPAFIPITILKSREGDVADNLEFKLRSDVAKRPEPSATDEPRQKKNNQDTTGNGNGIAENLNPKAVTQDTLTAGKSIEEVLKQKQTENDTSSNIEVVDYTTTVGHKVKNITTDTLNYRSHTTNAGPRNVKREEKINRENPLQKFVPPQDTKGDFKSMPAWKKLVRILYEDFIEFLSKLFK